MDNHKNNLIKDMAIIALSVLIGIILAKTGILINILTSSKELKLLGSFISGMFFTSIFTVVPATVLLAEIAKINSIFLVAFFGGMGAMVGDMVIFQFVKGRLSEDTIYLLKKSKSKRLALIFQLKIFRWLIAFLGALVIASPLPDELGLVMMGLSKIKISLFVPISFLLNFFGILIIGFVAKSIM